MAACLATIPGASAVICSRKGVSSEWYPLCALWDEDPHARSFLLIFLLVLFATVSFLF